MSTGSYCSLGKYLIKFWLICISEKILFVRFVNKFLFSQIFSSISISILFSNTFSPISHRIPNSYFFIIKFFQSCLTQEYTSLYTFSMILFRSKLLLNFKKVQSNPFVIRSVALKLCSAPAPRHVLRLNL